MIAPRYSDTEVEELLGAYALDACEPEEVEAIEMVLARRADLADEAARLAQVAAWIGAAQALRAPDHLRSAMLARAVSRRVATTSAALDLYLELSSALGETIQALPAAALDDVTPNGLTARELIVHVAAQESLLAQLVGTPTLGSVQETDIDARTDAALTELAGRTVDDVVVEWQAAVSANRRWATNQATGRAARIEWRGIDLSGDDVLVVRAFETWVHAEDLRRVGRLPGKVPEPRHLALMTDLAGRSLGLSLALAGRERPGRTAQLVLTGPGGGAWLVAMDGQVAAPAPDVTVTADAVAWCRLVGDRLDPTELEVQIDGDRALAEDILVSASALATL